MSHELRFGINILQNLPYEQLVERWKQVETLGYDSLWLADHFATGMRPDGIWFDGWSMLTAMAVQTSSIRIGTAVSSLILHNPIVFSKRAMTVDHISGGRLDLGIGAGGASSDWEQQMIGDDVWSVSERTQRFQEFIEIVDRLLTNPKSSYQGQFYRADEALVIPSPVQKPRPPFMLAAHGTKSLKIAAQYADTWNSYGKARVSAEECLESARQQMEQLDEYCAEIGRNPKEIRRSFYPFIGGHRFAASLDAFYDFVEQYREIGFTEFILTWMPEEARPVVGDGAITNHEMLEQIATEAIPKLRSEK